MGDRALVAVDGGPARMLRAGERYGEVRLLEIRADGVLVEQGGRSSVVKLGSQVTVVEIMDQVLPGVDPELVRVVARHLKELGIEVCVKSKAKDGTAPAQTLAFSAASGGPLDEASLTWSVSRDDDTDPGAVADGVFSPYPFAGGVVTVTAADGCGHTGSATVTLTLAAALGSPPAGTEARFGGPQVIAGAGRPQIVYPNTDTRFPRNIYKQLFQWVSNGGQYYRITFTRTRLDGAGLHRRRPPALRRQEPGRRLLGIGRRRLDLHRLRRIRHRDGPWSPCPSPAAPGSARWSVPESAENAFQYARS